MISIIDLRVSKNRTVALFVAFSSWTASLSGCSSGVRTSAIVGSAKKSTDKGRETVETTTEIDHLDEASATKSSSAPESSTQASPPTAGLSDNDIFVKKSEHDVLHAIGDGGSQLDKVCARNAGKTNRLIRALCVDKVKPTSLVELQRALGLDVANNQSTLFAITGHSSSLVARFVNAINPRIVMFTNPNTANIRQTPYVALGFARGEQLVEVIANNPDTQSPDFFLVLFKQACTDRPGGCAVGELLTPGVESNWTGFTVYGEDDLKNTVLDCRHCHQPGGTEAPKLLRMQELRNPWTHWFRANNNGGGLDLLADYTAAHGPDETYGGIPGNRVTRNNGSATDSNAPQLEAFVRATSDNGRAEYGNANSPNGGGGSIVRAIQDEVVASLNGRPAGSPGESAVWRTVFQTVARGERIPIPYHSPRITDPAKLAEATAAYQAFRANPTDEALIKNMKDFRSQIFRTEPAQLADMGFAVPDTGTPQEMLNLACSQCHNSRLDQTISRAKFNVDLSAMGDKKNAGISEAIRRLKLGYSQARREADGFMIKEKDGKIVTGDQVDHVPIMPPPRFKDLTDAQIDTLVTYLESQKTK